MSCPNCGRRMSGWSLGPPDHEPAWHCSDCLITLSDDEADELMEQQRSEGEE